MVLIGIINREASHDMSWQLLLIYGNAVNESSVVM